MYGTLRNMTSLYLVEEDCVLCLFRQGSRVANNKYIGTCGGHFEPVELNNAKRCILREMEEELGLTETDVEGLSLRYVTHRLKNGEIQQNYYFFGRLRQKKELSSNEGILRWISFTEIPALDMPISAKHMILHYIKEGRFNNCLYAGITQQTGTTFIPMVEFEG